MHNLAEDLRHFHDDVPTTLKRLHENGDETYREAKRARKEQEEWQHAASEATSGIKTVVDRQGAQGYGEERRIILDCLTPIDYAPQQNDFIAQRQEGTGSHQSNISQQLDQSGKVQNFVEPLMYPKLDASSEVCSNTESEDDDGPSMDLDSEGSDICLDECGQKLASLIAQFVGADAPEMDRDTEGRPCPFQYQPLDASRHEIRLLKLSYRTEWSNLVEGEIQTFSLDDKPDYVAVSYAWGDPRPVQPVVVNKRVVWVPENLHQLLSNMQYVFGLEVWFWIDALCINQDDTHEKSIQVQNLRRTFLLSSSIIAWLGECPHDHLYTKHGHAAMRFLKKLGRNIANIYLDSDEERELQEKVRTKIGLDTLPTDSMTKIFENPIWKRAWCLQEISMPSDKEVTLVLGIHKLSWHMMLISFVLFTKIQRNKPICQQVSASPRWTRFWRAVERLRTPFLACRDQLLDPTSTDGSNTPRLSLRSFLSLTRNSAQATDPRDMVYSLLSLAYDAHQYSIPVDYSLTCAEVYKRTATLLYPHGDHQILYDAQSIERKVPGLPSFVPDWSAPGIKSIITVPESRQDEDCTPSPFRAGGNEKPEILVDPTCTTMKIRGIIFDFVFVIGSAWRGMETLESATPRSWLRSFQELFRTSRALISDSCEIYTSQLEACHALFCTPIANPYDRCPEDGPTYIELPSVVPTEDIPVEGMDMKKWAYVEALNTVAPNRRCFVTSQGFLGLGPHGIEKDDTVCVFLGVEVPFVIRKLSNGHHILIGDAYIYGIMYGELIAKGLSSEIFELV